MAGKIKVVQRRSTIATPKKVKKVVQSMGLRGIGSEKLYPDNNCIRGMVNKVRHLVDVELVKE